MIVNVNQQEPEEQKEFKVEVKNVNVPGIVFFIIISLGMIVFSIFGLTGDLGDESGDASGFIVMAAMGVVFALVGAAALMGHYKVKNYLIQLVLGIALTIFGFGVPIISFGMGCFFIVFGLVGIYLIIRAINTMRGRHEENKELDGQISDMVGGVVDKFVGTDEDNL